SKRARRTAATNRCSLGARRPASKRPRARMARACSPRRERRARRAPGAFLARAGTIPAPIEAQGVGPGARSSEHPAPREASARKHRSGDPGREPAAPRCRRRDQAVARGARPPAERPARCALADRPRRGARCDLPRARGAVAAKVADHVAAIRLLDETVASIRLKTGPALEQLLRGALPRLTAGRYRDVRWSEPLDLRVFSSERGDFVAAKELSGGTNEALL